jgi:hypothetical protein
MAELEWSILANYAENPPQGGLVYIIGGGWDTVTIGAPLEGAPPGIVAAVAGHLIIRFLFHSTETGRDHTLGVVILDEDGGEVGRLEAQFRVERAVGLPTSWQQGNNVVLPLTGLGLPKFGLYDIAISLDGNHVGTRPFRVLKGY